MATLKISSDLQNAIKKVVLDTYFPVGSLYLTVGSENPNNTIGGTWVRFGNGKTLVGVDTNDSDFNSVEKIGGNKNQNALNKLYTNLYQGTSAIVSEQVQAGNDYTANRWSYSSDYRENTYTSNWKTKISGSLPVLQPYITIYIWKRTA